MRTLWDKLVEIVYDDNYEELTSLLINLDNALEYLHNNGFCIYDFNPKKIYCDSNDKFSLQSFKDVINDIEVMDNIKQINLYQIAKIGLMAYNKQVVDGKMNQEYFDFIHGNKNIPEEIMNYYKEIFINLKNIYLNDYLVNIQE